MIALREQAEHIQERATIEASELALRVQKSVSEVESHVDTVEEDLSKMDGHYTTELFMLQFMMTRLAEDATESSGAVIRQVNEQML
eukprot:SAG25_NODE_14407_length_255_cov_0.666667_1_plen_85_part_11